MRVFAISDLHVNYAENAGWVSQLSTWDHQQDVLICAGDIAHTLDDLTKALTALRSRFHAVAYVPGNHELWVRHEPGKTSLVKFQEVQRRASECGIQTGVVEIDSVSIVPVLGWYDHSFAVPSHELLQQWADYHLCVWPEHFDQARILEYFLSMNAAPPPASSRSVISFSHFVPRSDLLPPAGRMIDFLRPVLGSNAIDAHIRKLGSLMHIYGHHHVNQRVERDHVVYINNAFGYPHESHIATKRLLCVRE